MEYTPIKRAEYFIICTPAPSIYTDITSMPPLSSPLFSLIYAHMHMHVFFFTCSHKQDHAPPESTFQASLRADWSVPFLSLLQLRCFLFCQNAALQVDSDLKTSSPWGCLQHSLLSSFKHNLSRCLLSVPPPPTVLSPTPRSLQCLVLFPASQLLLLPEPSSLRETLVHGPPHLPSTLPFN